MRYASLEDWGQREHNWTLDKENKVDLLPVSDKILDRQNTGRKSPADLSESAGLCSRDAKTHWCWWLCTAITGLGGKSDVRIKIRMITTEQSKDFCITGKEFHLQEE